MYVAWANSKVYLHFCHVLSTRVHLIRLVGRIQYSLSLTSDDYFILPVQRCGHDTPATCYQGSTSKLRRR